MDLQLATWSSLFAEFPSAWIAIVFVLGLLVGSFLNVVIHRLPIMLDREWRTQAREILSDEIAQLQNQNAALTAELEGLKSTASVVVASAAADFAADAQADRPSYAVERSDAADVSAPLEPQHASIAPPPHDQPVASSEPVALESPPAPSMSTASAAERYNLVVPRSACPSCGKMITAAQNIPIVSWLLLRGKCANCNTAIPVRYPLVELLTAILSALVAWKFGFHWYTGAALLFTWMLIGMSGIDFDTKLLPDDMTLPLLWIGLLLSVIGAAPGVGLPVDARSSMIGAAAGYLSLWGVYQAFKLVTGKEGMGYGDFKLLAALGAWLGWQSLPLIILVSAFAGAIVGITLVLVRGRDRDIPIPFGPYLAAAGWIALMWGDQLMGSYLYMTGLAQG